MTAKSTPTSATAAFIEACAAVHNEIGTLVKSEENKYARYAYVSIDAYFQRVPEVAAKHGIWWTCTENSPPVVVEVMSRSRDDRDARAMSAVQTSYLFNVLFSGSDHAVMATDVITIVHPVQGAQTAGSSRSYAEKLFMRSLFKLVTGEMDADATEQYTMASPAVEHDMTIQFDVKPKAETASVTMPKEPDTMVVNEPPQQKPSPIMMEEEEMISPHNPETGEIIDDKVSQPDDEVLTQEDIFGALVTDNGEPTYEIDKNIAVDDKSMKIVYSIFETFLPDMQTKRQAREFWKKNIATMEKIKRERPEWHLKITNLFKSSVQGLEE